jgi:hypothetical protein
LGSLRSQQFSTLRAFGPRLSAFQLFGGGSPLTVDRASLSSQTAPPYDLSPRRLLLS